MAVRAPKAHTELENLLELYRIAFEASPIGMSFVSPDWRFVECNPALCAMLGRSDDELRGRSATDFTHPDDVDLHTRDQQRLIDGEIDHYELEARYIHKDGHAGWVSVHVGVIRDGERAIKLAIALVEDITEGRRMREIHERLLGLMLVGRGAGALAQALADLIQSPVALLDGYGQTLATGEHAGSAVRIPAREHLPRAPGDPSPAGLIVHPLHLSGRVEGWLVAEDPVGAEHLTAMAIDQAASSFALQLAMTRNAEEVEHRLHGDLFDAMLSDSPPPVGELMRWGQRLGHDLSTLRLVAFLRPVDVGATELPASVTRLTRTARAAAEQFSPGSLAVPRGDAVLVAATAGTSQQGRAIAERLVQRIHELTGERVVVGIGREVGDPAELGEALGEARQALDAVIALPRLGPVAVYGDLDMHHLLLGKKAPEEIVRAARRTLGPLLDAPQRDKWITTLAAYLDCVGSLEATARRLDIHVNTLRRRLVRIEGALELDLQGARNRVNLQLALGVLGLES